MNREREIQGRAVRQGPWWDPGCGTGQGAAGQRWPGLSSRSAGNCASLWAVHVSKTLVCFRGRIPKEFGYTKPCILRTWHRACGTSLPISCPAWKLLGGPDGSG